MGGDDVGGSNAAPEIIRFFVGFLVRLIIAVIVISLVLLAAGLIHIRHSPTPDELFGCTPANTSPSGECK